VVASPVAPIFDALARVAVLVDVRALNAWEHERVGQALGDEELHLDRAGGRVFREPPSQGALELTRTAGGGLSRRCRPLSTQRHTSG
jgi:hypothetical protein